MQIDTKRLTKDCAKVQSVLAESGHAHCGTGATAIIEPVLPLIRELRARKHSWAAIAAALARQGVVQGVARQPITARRLTALISAIGKRERRHAKRSESRFRRQDLARSPTQSRTLTLSADLRPTSVAANTVTDSEETIRRRDLEGLDSILRKDPT
jgi:hypothetical protein